MVSKVDEPTTFQDNSQDNAQDTGHQSLAQDLRNLLDPTTIGYVAAKDGSAFLFEHASDEQIIELARLLVVDALPPEQAFEKVFPESTDVHLSQSVYLALLRFRVKAVAFAKDLGGDQPRANTELMRIEDKDYQLPTTFNEGAPTDSVIKSCIVAPENSNPIADLAFLIEIQKRRLIAQIRELALQPSSFDKAKAFNTTVNSIRSLLKDMAHMQVEFGLRRRVPKQIDIRVQNAFQNFVDILGEDKSAVESLGAEILSILEDKNDIIDANYKELDKLSEANELIESSSTD